VLVIAKADSTLLFHTMSISSLCSSQNAVHCILPPMQNHYTDGEEKIKGDFVKLHEDMQEAFRKLEE